MPYTQLQQFQFTKGFRFEFDLVVSPGQIIAIRNNQYAYDEVQYWGAFSLGDYNLFDGGNILVNQTVLCYHKSHALRVPPDYPEAQFPMIYSPDNYRLPVLNVTFFGYTPP